MFNPDAFAASQIVLKDGVLDSGHIMASHGVPRVQQQGAKTAKAIEKEQQELAKYQNLVDKVQAAVRNSRPRRIADRSPSQVTREDFSHSTLDLTSSLLKMNPEYYTIWNHRRRVLRKPIQSRTTARGGHESEAADVPGILRSDLEFVLPLLMKFPKCYWIWNHRIWLLQQASQRCSTEVAKQFWKQEFELVGKMLSRDSRNFHGWSYRRMVVEEMRRLEPDENDAITQQEFAYTTKMVGSNLSNFSAWHQRSKLLPRLLDERQATDADRRKTFDAELDKVEEALSIDPYDQSLWFHHLFLMTELESDRTCFSTFSDDDCRNYLLKRLEIFRELLDDIDDCKWIYQSLLGFATSLKKLGDSKAAITEEDVRSWLERLRKLDPLRAGRWADLESKLGLG